MRNVITQRTIVLLAAVVVCRLMCGCVSLKPQRDVRSLSDELIQEMLASPSFAANYDVERKSKGKLPIVAVVRVENDCSLVESRAWLRDVADLIRMRLLDSGLFAVYNYEAANFAKGQDGREVPDLIMTGTFHDVVYDADCRLYRLRLSLYNTTGMLVWSGVKEVVQKN